MITAKLGPIGLKFRKAMAEAGMEATPDQCASMLVLVFQQLQDRGMTPEHIYKTLDVIERRLEREPIVVAEELRSVFEGLKTEGA